MMKNKKTVVLVHGLWMNHWVMMYLGWQFKKNNFQVYYFDYPTVRGDLQQNAISLANFIQSLQLESACLVGHSLGGLVCLEYLSQYKPAQVQSCLLMGVPVHGSQVARSLLKYRIGRFLLGKSASALVAEHGHKLNESTALIIGTGGQGMGRLVCRLRPPHDGAVTYNEAYSGELIKNSVLAVSHTTMLFSKLVAKAAIQFCHHGEFPDDLR